MYQSIRILYAIAIFGPIHHVHIFSAAGVFMNCVFIGNDWSPAPGCYLNHATGIYSFTPEIVGEQFHELIHFFTKHKDAHFFADFVNDRLQSYIKVYDCGSLLALKKS